mmetsp:Transcript_32417/g.85236  ORF Transcript_32417/g.85236 Transcript_32417/m.85236 type:complete len:362 (+) Transcript_32417:846-1931(+)
MVSTTRAAGTADRPPITHTYHYYAPPSFSLSLSLLQPPVRWPRSTTTTVAVDRVNQPRGKLRHLNPSQPISTHPNPSRPICAPTFLFLVSPTTYRYIPTEEVPAADLEDIINRSCTAFRDPGVTPVVKTGDCWTMELFHGPTFAFKDVALQFLGNLFEYFIDKKEGDAKRLTIMGATSGDTGSAAIYGLRGKKNVHCFILYPKGRVSLIQEQQMSTVPDSNIHCLRVEGTFDDAQDIVKAAFMDTEFRNKVRLGAVNSINWARVLAQMTYYFYSYYRVTDQAKGVKKVSFSVPTGNFGDILAGFYAKKMGLPVGKLVVGTNENDILHRFFSSGTCITDHKRITTLLSTTLYNLNFTYPLLV